MTPDLHITIYNIFYTGGIPLVVAVVDKILPAEALAQNAALYQYSSRMQIYTKTAYWGTVLDASEFFRNSFLGNWNFDNFFLENNSIIF